MLKMFEKLFWGALSAHNLLIKHLKTKNDIGKQQLLVGGVLWRWV